MPRMRSALSLAWLTWLAAAPIGTRPAHAMQDPRKPAVETPNESDVPKPVPGDVGLAGAAAPDITRFLNVRTAGAPSLSPDGKRLAFRTGITGAPQLWVVDAAGGWPEQLTFGEAVTFHRWSPSGEWIAYGCDRGGNEREGFYLVAPDGTKERELLKPSEAFRQFGGFSRDGKRIAYATTERNGVDFDVHVIDVASGVDTRVLEGKGGLYPAAWRPDGGALLLSETRGEDANDVHLLDLSTGKVETLFKPQVPSRFENFAWKRDSSGFYLTTDQEREFSALAWFDAQEKKLTFVELPERDVEAVALSPDDRVLAWTLNEGGASKLLARDLTTGKDLDVPALPRGLYSIGFAARAEVAAITVGGPQVPGDVWTWRADAAPGALAVRATRSATAGL